MNTLGPVGLSLFCGLILAGSPAGLYAASGPALAMPATAGNDLTIEALAGRVAEIETTSALDAATKARVKQIYEQALRFYDDGRKAAAAAADFDRAVRSAPADVAQAKQELAALSAAGPRQPPAQATVEELEQVLAQEETALKAAQQMLAEVQAESSHRVSGRAQITEALAKVRGELADSAAQLAAPVTTSEPAEVAAAQRVLMQARHVALVEQIVRYEKQLAAYDATAELLPLRNRLAGAHAALSEETVRRWRQTVAERRRAEAAWQAELARDQVEQVPPPLQQLADDNRELAEERAQIAAQNKQLIGELDRAVQAAQDLRAQFQRTREKVEAGKQSSAIGLLLRTERSVLPKVNGRYRNLRARQAETRRVQLRVFELEDRLRQTPNPEQLVEEAMAELRHTAPGALLDELEPAVRDLLSKEAAHLDSLTGSYYERLKLLVDLDTAERDLIAEVDAYAAFIDERVLWIRSTDALGSDEFSLALVALAGLADPRDWLDVGRILLTQWPRTPLLAAAAVLVFLVWFVGGWRLRNWLALTGEAAAQNNAAQMLPTIAGLVLTVLLAAPGPCLLWYVAWRLDASLDGGDFAKAVGTALAHVASVWLPLEFFRQISRRGGVAEAHFRWPAGSVQVLRRHIAWVIPATLPPLFLTGLVEDLGLERWHNSLGRLSFIAMMILAVCFLRAVLRPSGNLFRHLLAAGHDGPFYRFRHVWCAVGVAAPAAMALLAAAGYYYTAQQLASRLRETIYLPLALTVLGAFLSRWVLLLRRKLAIDHAKRRRAAAMAEAAGEGAEASAPVEPQPDFSAMSLQVRRLVLSFLVLAAVLGTWIIWVDVLPALAIFDEVPLWHTTIEVAESTALPDGTPALLTVTRAVPITLADVTLALLVVLMTVIAMRNLSGAMEIAMPRWLPLDAGARYAIIMVSRYLVLVLGLVLTSSTLGISWSKVQWLVAAISVGLGFGLQEIFANFVSGLIILFEQPIRVGDVVSMGDVTGTVSRINTRATTITNSDRKELIVPNKEFITGKLLNWTLSDQVNRVVVEVGVAYGTDTDLAAKLLLAAAAEQPSVLKDPAPSASFERFGESTLDFALRCFLPNLENRGEVIHRLHSAIHRSFQDAGIEIAYPQRDLRLRVDGPVLERMLAGAHAPHTDAAHEARLAPFPAAPARRAGA